MNPLLPISLFGLLALAACSSGQERTPKGIPEDDRVQTIEHIGDQGPSDEELQKQIEQLERVKKGLEVLAEFPPPKWGPQRVKQIADKHGKREPLTKREWQFIAKFELWMVGDNYRRSVENK